MKTVIIVLSGFLLVALLAVGFLLVVFYGVIPFGGSYKPTTPAQQSDIPSTTRTNTSTTRTVATTTINTSALSEGQQTLLRTLGIDADNFTVTPEMAACAEAKLGAMRLKEIEGGATPTFTEGLTLLSCYRK